MNVDRRYRKKLFLLVFLIVFFFMATKVAQGSDPAVLSSETRNALATLSQEVKSSNYSFTVGYNPAMEYSISELCGLVMPENLTELTTSSALLETTTLPPSFDWRALGGVTSVKHQYGCGSCWAFSTVAALESAIKIRLGVTEDISEQHLVSCNEDGWGCSGGWWAHDYHMNKTPFHEPEAGAVLEDDFPYQAKDVPCQPPHKHHYKIKSWSYVGAGRTGVPTVDQIKQAIHTYGPVCAGVYADNAFQAYTGGVFDKHVNRRINHAILLVGWDDNYVYNGKTYGVWILKNSWGDWWGENGYMYIQYDTSGVGTGANFVDLGTPSDIAFHDEIIDGGNYQVSGSITASPNVTVRKGANVIFTAGNAIKAGGRFIIEEGAQVTFEAPSVTVENGFVVKSGAKLIIREANAIIAGPDFVIENGAEVIFRAVDSITMLPGFTVNEDSRFDAVITKDPEACDNIDNDDDGKIDENLIQSCSNACGSGIETCRNGQWTGCTAPQPQLEIIDGRDNDCDGLIDEEGIPPLIGSPCTGDVNGDGGVTPQDALLVFKCYLGSGVCPDCCDVNKDGTVTPSDALCLFQAYLGQPSCLD